MAQELQRPSLAASLGQAAGGGVNKALLDILNGIAQNKISQLEDRQQAFQPQGNPVMRDLALISENRQPQQIAPAMEEDISQSPLRDALSALAPKEEAPQEIKIKPKSKTATKATPKQAIPKAERQAVDKINKMIDKPSKATPAEKAEEIAELNPDPIKHAAVKAEQDKKIAKIPKLSEKQQLAADKETKPYFDEISKHGRAAQEGNQRLDRMLELIKGGNLVWPSVASFLDVMERGIPLFGGHIGLDLRFVENADTHEFRKLSSDFVKGAKDVFGGRITNLDLESYLKTIPNVSQTDAGKIRVIRNMRLLNAGSMVRKKAMDEIIDENDGQRPPNLEYLVEQRSKDQLDSLADKFKKGIMEPDELAALEGARNRLLGNFQ